MQEPVSNHVAYGGQAVIEGVMMRGRRQLAVAVRAPSGEILVWSDDVTSSRLARRVRNWPFVRGAILLWDTMGLGVRALLFSAAIANRANRDARRVNAGDQSEGAGELGGPILWLMVAVSIAFSIALFFVLPLGAVASLDRFIASSFVSNLIEGLIRLGLVVGYMYVIGYLPDIRRVFAYHGAEHKTIHAWEAGEPIDVPHVRRHSLEHPRCGTSFLLVVVILSVVLFMTLGRPDLLTRIASRIVLVPVVAGVAYEFLKFGARHADNWLLRIVMMPGLKLQRLTTREPDDSMIEVAIAAFLRVLASDGRLSENDPRLAAARRVDASGNPLDAPVPRTDPLLEPVAAD